MELMGIRNWYCSGQRPKVIEEVDIGRRGPQRTVALEEEEEEEEEDEKKNKKKKKKKNFKQTICILIICLDNTF